MPTFVYKLLVTQLAFGALATLLGWALAGLPAAVAAALGGGIGTVATFFGARRSFSAKPGSRPEQIWGALVRGEVVKATMIISALLICLKYLQTGQLWLVGTLFATLLATRASLLLTSAPGRRAH